MEEIYKIEYKLSDWIVFREEKFAFDEMEEVSDLESIVQDIASYLRDSDEDMPIDYLTVRVNGKKEYRFRITEEKVSIFYANVLQ